jgi:hypothetical protein
VAREVAVNKAKVGQDNVRASWRSVSPRARSRAAAVNVLRRNENEGCEESRLPNQRRSVEGSATRSGSATVGAADSREQCSTK